MLTSSTLDATETLSYTWEELGVPADVVPYVTDNEYAPQTWAATWDGEPSQADLTEGSGQMLATPAGFLQWADETLFSPDGLTWTASPLPNPDGYVLGGFAFNGGVIVVSTSPDGTVVYRLDETGGSPTLLDLPDLPRNFLIGFSPWASTSGLIVRASGLKEVGPEGGEELANLWLIASNDGEQVVATNLDGAATGGPPIVVTNGDVALAQVGGRWTRFDLA